MKKITEDWFSSAESDLLLIKEIKRIRNFLSFCQSNFPGCQKEL